MEGGDYERRDGYVVGVMGIHYLDGGCRFRGWAHRSKLTDCVLKCVQVMCQLDLNKAVF